MTKYTLHCDVQIDIEIRADELDMFWHSGKKSNKT
jgi:hypothetical protein